MISELSKSTTRFEVIETKDTGFGLVPQSKFIVMECNVMFTALLTQGKYNMSLLIKSLLSVNSLSSKWSSVHSN